MKGGASQGNQPDNSMSILWGIAAIFFVLGIIWYNFKAQIVGFYLHIKLWETDQLLHLFPGLQDLRTAIVDTLQANPQQVSLDDVVTLGTAVGNYVRFPLMAVIILLAAWSYFGTSTRIFKNIYTARDLSGQEKLNWPQITPVIGLDLVKADIDKGPWAMALTPMQFCKKYDLLIERRFGPQEGVSRKDWQRVEVTLNKGKANRIFVLQLGPVWRGAQALPPHVKALFAAFAARINGDTAPAMALFASINRSSSKKLDFTGTDALLKKHFDTSIVRKVVSSHAYLLTVMAEMLVAARNDGVQGVADFLWLKPIDRRLWYMLNTVGRQTPFPEVAGPFAHWLAEKEAGHKLLVPMVHEATNALALSLTEIIYRPDEKDA